MDPLHEKVMATGRVLEFRRHHEVALDDGGRTVCLTRAEAVFKDDTPKEAKLSVVEAVLSAPPGMGFVRQSRYWSDTDDYGRHTVEVHYTDVEGPPCQGPNS